MLETRRRLPHIYLEGKWLFVTWHLHGSLLQNRYPPRGLRAGAAFIWMDRYLGTTRVGPMYLRREDIARIVVNSLRRGVERGHYDLRAWVVMANHVHVLLLPKAQTQRLLGALKGCTAREANQVLGRTGQPCLASRILRSLGQRRARVRKDRGLYRKQSRERRIRDSTGRLPLV